MRTTIEGRTIEDAWPTLAPPRFHVDWSHQPVGPFRAQAWHQSMQPGLAAFEVHHDFGWMMERFCTRFTPPQLGYTALILDESFSVVFGVCATAMLYADTNGQAGWYGVRAAFEWMENSGLYDMMDLAVWEARAMESATGVEL